MNTQDLIKTAQAMVADDEGVLTMDEHTPTCDKRFDPLGIPKTADTRRDRLSLIVTKPGFAKSIGGAILYGETSDHASGWTHYYPPPISVFGSLK